MEFRNPVYTVFGDIDAEVNHPIYGWIPCTLSPDDPETADMYDLALAAGPSAYVAPPVIITGADVDIERDRRVVAGVVIAVTGYGNVELQGRDVDQRNLQGLAFAAQMRIAGGAGATLTPFRARNNVIHQLSQPQVIDLWSKGAAFVSAVFQAAWALKDGASIPADFANDSYWP